MVGDRDVDSSVARIGRLIVTDIERRGLGPGQRYLTAQEAGREFGVSPALASRAMRRLAERDFLVRKAGAGTFVGPKVVPGPETLVQCVEVLVPPARLQQDLPVRQLTEGLIRAMAGYDVLLNVLSHHSSTARTRELLERLSSTGVVGGLVLVGCPREIQELVCEMAIPAVVFGGVFPSTRSLPSVDADWHAVGRETALALLEGGHRRMGLVMNDQWLAGDNDFFDGVSAALAEAGLSYGALVMRSLPMDEQLVSGEVRRLLEGPDRPTALICRHYFCRIVLEAARSLSLNVPEDLMLISDAQGPGLSQGLSWPIVCPELAFDAQAEMAGRMLRELIEGRRPEPEHVAIDVRRIEPQVSESATMQGMRKGQQT